MSDTPAAPATDKAAAVAIANPISPGWKTTEMWLTTLLLAGLGTVIEELVKMLPALAAQPNANPMLVVGVPVAIGALGLAATWAKTTYTKQRAALKLASTPPATDAAAALAFAKGAGAAVLLLCLFAALMPMPARAQVLQHDEDCAELADAGVPILVPVKMPAGTTLTEDLWTVTPRTMCAAGATQQTCQAEQQATPVLALTALGVLGLLVGGAIALGVASGTGHLR